MTVDLKIDFLIHLHANPYRSINKQDVRLKSSPISLWSLIGAEGQEMCLRVPIGLLPLWIQQELNVYVCRLRNNPPLASCCLLPFQNLLFLFFFHDIPKTKFKCLLSSSNQTARDILEKK